MKALLERSRYILLIAVVALFAASLTALGLGVVKTVNTITGFFGADGKLPTATVLFIELMDIFLVGAILYIFAIALYELFIGDLAMPEWLVIHDLDELKSKLAGILVLVIVIAFAEHFIESEDPQAMLLTGVGGAAMIGALTLYNRSNSSH